MFHHLTMLCPAVAPELAAQTISLKDPQGARARSTPGLRAQLTERTAWPRRSPPRRARSRPRRRAAHPRDRRAPAARTDPPKLFSGIWPPRILPSLGPTGKVDPSRAHPNRLLRMGQAVTVP